MTDFAERPFGTRYRVEEPDGSWWELGWDRPLATFYAQHYSPLPFDPFSSDDLLDWHGTDVAELATLDALAARLPVALPEEVKAELAADAAAHPTMGPPRFLAAARHLVEALDGGSNAANTAGQPRASAPQPAEAHPDGPDEAARRWSLPAAPLGDALRLLHADPRLGDDDVTTFAIGLGLDPGLVRGVLAGAVSEFGVDDITTMCEALHCSPEQVWGTALAGAISHAYGPEDWPAHTEPLVEAGSGAGVGGTPVTLEAVSAPRTGGPHDIHAMAAGGDNLVVLATCYQQTGVLAVDADGNVEEVDHLTQPPDPHAEYHCRFRQVTESAALAIPMDEGRFTHGPLGHVDAEPALAEAAQRLRIEVWPTPVDMVRFSMDDGGAEQWLGWDARTTCWQTWDDPRSYYGGDPRDVLDPAGLVDARSSADPQLCLDELLDDLASSHNPDRSGVEVASSDCFDL